MNYGHHAKLWVALALLLSLSLSACSTTMPESEDPAGENEQIHDTTKPDAALETPSADPVAPSAPSSDDVLSLGYFIFYQDEHSTIFALPREEGGFEHYLYRIGAAAPYLAEGRYQGSTVTIDDCNGILRLLMGSGNTREQQYFDVARGRKSELIWLDSHSIEYIDPVGEHYLVAYIAFDTSKDGAPAYLVIQDIFSGEIIATIDRPFNMGTMPLNELVFVNENEIYIDYDMDFVNGELVSRDEWVTVTETVAFRGNE